MTFDYETYYQGRASERGWDGERSSRWTHLNAVVKADHVVRLLKRSAPGAEAAPGVETALRAEGLSVLEVGCGDGQVLTELAHRGFGPKLVGAEVSETAAQIAQGRKEISQVRTFDGARLPFLDSSFELVLATHVLEHVTDPLALLLEMRRVAASFVVIEVPLEDNLAARRPRAISLSRQVGHIQRFNRSDVRALIAAAGLRRVSDLADPLPRELRAFHDGGVRGTAKWAMRSAVLRLPFGERFMTVHYAALAVKPHGQADASGRAPVRTS